MDSVILKRRGKAQGQVSHKQARRSKRSHQQAKGSKRSTTRKMHLRASTRKFTRIVGKYNTPNFNKINKQMMQTIINKQMTKIVRKRSAFSQQKKYESKHKNSRQHKRLMRQIHHERFQLKSTCELGMNTFIHPFPLVAIFGIMMTTLLFKRPIIQLVLALTWNISSGFLRRMIDSMSYTIEKIKDTKHKWKTWNKCSFPCCQTPSYYGHTTTLRAKADGRVPKSRNPMTKQTKGIFGLPIFELIDDFDFSDVKVDMGPFENLIDLQQHYYQYDYLPTGSPLKIFIENNWQALKNNDFSKFKELYQNLGNTIKFIYQDLTEAASEKMEVTKGDLLDGLTALKLKMDEIITKTKEKTDELKNLPGLISQALKEADVPILFSIGISSLVTSLIATLIELGKRRAKGKTVKVTLMTSLVSQIVSLVMFILSRFYDKKLILGNIRECINEVFIKFTDEVSTDDLVEISNFLIVQKHLVNYPIWKVKEVLTKWNLRHKKNYTLPPMVAPEDFEGLRGGNTKTSMEMKQLAFQIFSVWDIDFVAKFYGLDYYQAKQWFNIKTRGSKYEDKSDDLLVDEHGQVIGAKSVAEKFDWMTTEKDIEVQKRRKIRMTRQFEFSKIVNLLQSAFFIIIAPLFSKMTGIELDYGSLAKNIRDKKTISTEANELKEEIIELFGGSTVKGRFLSDVDKHLKELNRYIDIPDYQYCYDESMFTSFKEKLAEVEAFLMKTPREFSSMCSPLQMLFNSGNTRRITISQNLSGNNIRQCPVGLLLFGKGAVGKTQAAEAMAMELAAEINKRKEPAKNVISITSSGKFWPQIQGEEVAYFDEFVRSKNIENNLLINNGREIMSSAKFKLEGAALHEKNQVCCFKIVMGTCNEEVSAIEDIISNGISKEAVAPFFSRFYSYICERNPKWGAIDLNNRGEAQYDHTGNYDHIVFRRIAWCEEKQMMLATKETKTYAEIKKQILRKIDHYTGDYLAKMQAMSKQASKDHFVINLHGEIGSGKSHNVSIWAEKFKSITGLNVVNIENIEQLKKVQKRSIFVVDDVIKMDMNGRVEGESEYMEWYNSKIGNNSIIFFITNTIPVKQPGLRFKFNMGNLLGFGYNFELLKQLFQIYRPYALPYQNPGMIRRTGFVGDFMDVNGTNRNICFNVKNFNFTEKEYPLISKETIIGDVPDVIFQKYMRYCNLRTALNIEVGVPERHPECNIMIEAASAQSVKMTRKLGDMISHVFTDRAKYDACMLPWKMYFDKEILIKASSNPDKFYIKLDRLDLQTIIDIQGKYNLLLNSLSINPVFYCNLGQDGMFSLKDNKLVYSLNQQVKFNFYKAHTGIVITDAQTQRSVNYQYSEIFDLIYNNLLSEQEKQFSFSDILSLREYINRLLLTDPELKKEFSNYLLKQKLNEKKVVIFEAFQKFKDFGQTDLGKIILAFISIGVLFSTYKVISKLIQVNYKNKKIKAKKQKKDEDFLEMLERIRNEIENRECNLKYSEEPQEVVEMKRKKPKKTDKNYCRSDDEDKTVRMEHEKKKKKSKTNDRNYVRSDDEDKKIKMDNMLAKQTRRRQKREVTTTTQSIINTLKEDPMNDYSALEHYSQGTDRMCNKNLGVMFMGSSSKNIVFGKAPGIKQCYGLLIGNVQGKVIGVTVKHLMEEAEKNYQQVFFRSDETDQNSKPTFYQVKPEFMPKYKDLCFFSVVDKTMSQPQSLLKKFLSRDAFEKYMWAAIALKRYGKDNEPEVVYGDCDFYYDDGIDFVVDGKDESFKWMGSVIFMYSRLMLTYWGDCGLPYICIDKNLPGFQGKILGIHCMGNSESGISQGVSSLITTDDIEELADQMKLAKQQKPVQFEEERCNFCNKGLFIMDNEYPKNEGDKICWNSEHDAQCNSLSLEFKEIRKYIGPDTKAIIEKNFGQTAGGTQGHSHTKFNISKDIIFEYPSDIKYIWQQKDKTFTKRQVFKNCNKIEEFFQQNLWIQEYKLTGISEKNEKLDIIITVTKFDMTQEQKQQLLFEANSTVETQLKLYKQGNGSTIEYPTRYGERVVYVPPRIANNMERIIKDLSTQPFDVPFKPDDDCISVVGSFRSNQSPLPNNPYLKIPGSEQLNFKPEKIPFNPDMSQATEEQKKGLIENNFGEIEARANQTVLWQCGNPKPPQHLITHVISEMKKHYLTIYSNLKPLTDEQILHGYPMGHPLRGSLGRLETDKAVGWTLKRLFGIQKKSDVLDTSEEGKITWRETEASEFLQGMFVDAKHGLTKGEDYFVAYNDLCKAEKLKIAKAFQGRIFCVQDTLGVLMERYVFGEATARAIKQDKTVGVGSNPFIVFDRMAKTCLKLKNHTTGDYSRWDKTLPKVLFEMFTELIEHANPQMKSFFKPVVKNIYGGIHVSGYTMYVKNKGMPSGCFTTAWLNCKINDIAMYMAFSDLVKVKLGYLPSWEEYEQNIERWFYGDDLLFAVKDEYAQIFNQTTYSKWAKDNLGLILGSAEKDGGEQQDFEKFEKLSWISRYFRKLDKFNFFVGALKKISINTYFHWTTNLSPQQIGSQLMSAQFEAAFWEQEYFDNIQKSIKILCSKNKFLDRYVYLIPRELIQYDMYIGGAVMGLFTGGSNPDEGFYNSSRKYPELSKEQYKAIVNDLSFKYQRSKDIPENQSEKQREKFLSKLHSIPFKARQEMANSIAKLNELFQKGIVSKPSMDFASLPEQRWNCVITCTYLVNNRTLDGVAIGQTKKEATDLAAAKLLRRMPKEEGSQNVKQGMTKQMNVNLGPGDGMAGPSQTAVEPVMATSTIGSNVSMPTDELGDFNPHVKAVTNISACGLPMEIKTFVTTVWQLHSTTSIKTDMQAGTQVFKLGTDPTTLPPLTQSYLKLHGAFNLDVSYRINIPSAMGTMGNLLIGWVRDVNREQAYTRQELRQISSKLLTLANGTMRLSFTIRDLINAGYWYRSWETLGQEGPFPGVVCILDTSLSQVNKNDVTTYPLTIECLLGHTELGNPSDNNQSAFSNMISKNIIDIKQFVSETFDIVVLNNQVATEVPNKISNAKNEGYIIQSNSLKNKDIQLITVTETVFEKSHPADNWIIDKPLPASKYVNPNVKTEKNDIFVGMMVHVGKEHYQMPFSFAEEGWTHDGNVCTYIAKSWQSGENIPTTLTGNKSTYTKLITPITMSFRAKMKAGKTFDLEATFGQIVENDEGFTLLCMPTTLTREIYKDDTITAPYIRTTYEDGSSLLKLGIDFKDPNVSGGPTFTTLVDADNYQRWIFPYNQWDNISASAVSRKPVRLYTPTTGLSATTIPNQAKLVNFIPSGSSLSEHTTGPMSIIPIEGMDAIKKAIDLMCARLDTEGAQFNITTPKNEVIGSLTYWNGEFLSQQNDDFTIATNIDNECILTDFIPIKNTSGIAGSVRNTAEWVSRPTFGKNRFFKQALTKQSWVAGLAGGVLGGIGQGLGNMQNQKWTQENMRLGSELQIQQMLAQYEQMGLINSENYKQMEERLRMQVQNQQDMQVRDQNFQMQKAGLSSASARRTGTPVSGMGRIDHNGVSLYKQGKNTFEEKRQGIIEHEQALDDKIDPLMGVNTTTKGGSDEFENVFNNNYTKGKADFLNHLDWTKFKHTDKEKRTPRDLEAMEQGYTDFKKIQAEMKKKYNSDLNPNAAEFTPRATVDKPKNTGAIPKRNMRINAIDFVKGKTMPGTIKSDQETAV